ncbi:MAG: AEC family transporter [Defluviitaleaceae bacterium]|nr:AEC family transporter [Defluviitaleaceae bacterium]
MLENLLFSINAVLPIFLVMIFGLILRRLNIVDSIGAKQMNAVLFNFALPVRLFLDVYRSDFSTLWDTRLILFTVISVVLFFFICWGAGILFMPDRQMKGAFIQGGYRSNYAIIGIPLVTSIMGYTPPAAALVTTFVVPLFNIVSVVILTVYSEEKVGIKEIIKSSAASVAKNPLIIGVLTGILFSLIRIPVPTVFSNTLFHISDLSTPLALIIIGASMNFTKAKERITPTLLACIIKLIAMPVLFLPFAFLFGISNEGIVILFVLYAAPTAISSYVMAYYMGSDEHLAANIIMFTSMMSIFTYTLGVYILRTLGVV